MRLCDICKTNGVRYVPYATIDESGNGATLELCGSCYNKLCKKERHHAYLAYKETVEEVTGKAPKKKSWLDIFKK
jgi:ribosome-binding protein aMBF1 (putative translation factor)